MPRIAWSEEYSIGVGQIDAEHRWLIDMLNTARDAARLAPDQECLEDLRDALQAYAATHFATEEALIEQTAYPETDGHIMLHRFFMDYIQPDKLKFEDEHNLPDMDKVVVFLTDWLLNHILRADKELGTYLQGHGVT